MPPFSFLAMGDYGGNMHIKHALSGLLIKAALSAKTPSEKKQRIMDLYFHGLITSDNAIHLIDKEGLKYE